MAINLNTKSYTFRGIVNAVSTYLNGTGLASSFSALTASLRVPVGKPDVKEKIRGAWKLSVPVVAEEAGTCACPGDVLRVSDADISFRMAANATLAERTDFALRLKDLTASPEFQASIINLQLPNA